MVSIVASLGRRLVAWFSLVSDLVQLTIALLGVLVLAGSGAAVAGYLQRNGLMLAVGIVVITASGTLWMVLRSVAARPVVGLGSRRLARRLSRQDLKLQLKEIVYIYDDTKTKLVQKKRFKVEALRDGVSSFTDRYLWTGEGSITLSTPTAGYRVVNERRLEFWNVYDVVFPHPVSRGVAVDFLVEWTLLDEYCMAQPFLSTMIDVKTDRLELRVRLPRAIRPSVAYAHSYQNYIHDVPVETAAAEWDESTEMIEFAVDHPVLNSKYVLNWQW